MKGTDKKDKGIYKDMTFQRIPDGKDEMNLAEFPLCTLANRVRREVKTLEFEDRTWDQGRNKWVTRRLVITGSDAYGLPTVKDDEVLLGLIQLTRLRGFQDRKVTFTRRELIRLIGWRDESKSYQRVEESLNRWTGVTLVYNKAWWNKQRKCWVDEMFHILDNVWLYHRDEPLPDLGIEEEPTHKRSAFKWNEVIFRSFSNGNLKSLDFEFFKSLKSAISKRLYRFLDKRFWHRGALKFNLKVLCCEHIGLARSYDTANLKRKLLGAIRELENRGFLRAMPVAERFTKLGPGEWCVHFECSEKGKMGSSVAKGEILNPLAQLLKNRGVTRETALRLVESHSPESVQNRIEAFDQLVLNPGTIALRNPPGFLIRSIQGKVSASENLQPPLTGPDRNGRVKLQKTGERKRRGSSTVADQQDHHRIENFLNALSESERMEFEAEALAQATGLKKTLVMEKGSVGVAAKRSVIEEFAAKRIAITDGDGAVAAVLPPLP